MAKGGIASLSRGLTSAAVLLLAQFVTARPAHATCGDYLMVQGESHQTAPTASQDAPAEPCPCRGPECHSSPGPPLPVPPERTFSSDYERWCTALAHDLPLQPSSSRLDRQGTLLIPQGFPATIDRPPRA